MANEQRICIYCPNRDERFFSGREHVVPQSFGTFGAQTPTLDCVCDECNSYFGRHLDQLLARETLEGVVRYQVGKFSTEMRPQRRLRVSLALDDEAGDFAGAVLQGIDPTTGHLLPPLTQFHIENRLTGKTDIFIRGREPVVVSDEIYGKLGARKTKIFAPCKQEHDDFIRELVAQGVILGAGEPFQLPETIREAAPSATLGVTIEGEVDDLHKRALAKVLINFAAKYVGVDEVSKPEWEAVERYVRYGEGLLGARFSDKPFWGDETGEMRLLSDSINMRIENIARGVLGSIQFYNRPIYQLLLIEGYHLDVSREVACRFTPGHEPQRAEKRPQNKD